MEASAGIRELVNGRTDGKTLSTFPFSFEEVLGSTVRCRYRCSLLSLLQRRKKRLTPDRHAVGHLFPLFLSRSRERDRKRCNLWTHVGLENSFSITCCFHRLKRCQITLIRCSCRAQLQKKKKVLGPTMSSEVMSVMTPLPFLIFSRFFETEEKKGKTHKPRLMTARMVPLLFSSLLFSFLLEKRREKRRKEPIHRSCPRLGCHSSFEEACRVSDTDRFKGRVRKEKTPVTTLGLEINFHFNPMLRSQVGQRLLGSRPHTFL